MAEQKPSESINKFLMQLLPMLIEQKFQRQYIDYNTAAWLKNQLQQYEAYGEEQRKTMQQSLQNAIAEAIIKSGFKEKEKLGYPTEQALGLVRPLVKPYGLEIPEAGAPPAEDLQKRLLEYSDIGRQMALAKVTGTVPPDEVIKRSVDLFGIDVTREELQSFSDAAAKRLDQLLRFGEIGIEERALPIRQREVAAREKEAEAKIKAEEPAEKARKEWLEFVKDVEDHLRQEGVKRDELSKDLAIWFGSGKVTDPLSPENRGKAYTYLGQIRSKLIQKQPLTEGDVRFLTTVRSTYQIERPAAMGGGMISPEAGMTEAEIRNRTLQTIIETIKKLTGVSDEQAAFLAKKYMSQLK